MALDYLDFDYSEDFDGNGTWDAMAAVQPERLPALRAELAQLLAWAHAAFAGRQGPCEDGGDWDYDLQAQDETGQPLHARYGAGTLDLEGAPGGGLTTVTLTLSGSPAFGAALRERWGV